MRALTVRWPYSAAIALNLKPIENRKTGIVGEYRGMVAIHQGVKAHRAWASDPIMWRAHASNMEIQRFARVRYWGAVIAVANLWAVDRPDECEGRCGPWSEPDAWHIHLSDAVRLPSPVPATGRLGLWTLPADVEAAVREQVNL